MLWLRPMVLILLVVGSARAADQVIVEDWSRHQNGHKGIPPGWNAQSWGSPTYEFAVVEDAGRRVLHLKSRNEGSLISKEIKGQVKLKETPILEWQWKAVALPRGGNSCKKEADDQVAQVYVTWPRFPESLRSRIIGYVWDSTAAAGTICKSEKTGTVTYVIMRSGPAELGKWLTERRNVLEDFRKIYGETPDEPALVSVAIDSNDTQSTAESFLGTLLFRRP
jgi:hypothetical protein